MLGNRRVWGAGREVITGQCPSPRTPACPGLGIQLLLHKPKSRSCAKSLPPAPTPAGDQLCTKHEGSSNPAEGDSLNPVSTATKPESPGRHPCPSVLQTRPKKGLIQCLSDRSLGFVATLDTGWVEDVSPH